MIRGFHDFGRDLPLDGECGRIRRHVAGDASAEDDAWVARWVGSDRVRRELLERARAAYDPARVRSEVEWRTEDAWARLLRQVETGTEPGIGSAPPRPARAPTTAHPRRRDSFRLLPAAAVVLLALVGSTLWWQRGRTIASTRMELQEVSTEAGQQARVRLVDGTTVVLAPESRLRYPGRFGDAVREVVLEGEAFFDVASEADRPFQVRARGSLTRVLGTEFTLRARLEERYVETVVTEGRVAFGPSGSGGAIELGPGEVGRLAADGTVSEARMDIDRALGWLEGRLYFDGAGLEEVVRALERRHGVRITLSEPGLGEIPITAELRGNDVSETVRLICISLGLESARTANGFLIHRTPATEPGRPRNGASPR